MKRIRAGLSRARRPGERCCCDRAEFALSYLPLKGGRSPAQRVGPAEGRPDGKLRPKGEGVAGGGSTNDPPRCHAAASSMGASAAARPVHRHPGTRRRLFPGRRALPANYWRSDCVAAFRSRPRCSARPSPAWQDPPATIPTKLARLGIDPATCGSYREPLFLCPDQLF